MNTFTKFAILNTNYPAGAGRLDASDHSEDLLEMVNVKAKTILRQYAIWLP